MATIFEQSEKNVANLSDVIAGAWGCEIPNKFCPSCVHRAKLALLFATCPEHIHERSELFVNDLRGESVDRREELATAKNHVPVPALLGNGIFLVIVFEEIMNGRR